MWRPLGNCPVPPPKIRPRVHLTKVTRTLSVWKPAISTDHCGPQGSQDRSTRRHRFRRVPLQRTGACLQRKRPFNIFLHHITSHHIEETEASLDRPLYLRNKHYDKTLKSQSYYSLRFPSGAMEICLVVIQYLLVRQNLSKRFFTVDV